MYLWWNFQSHKGDLDARLQLLLRDLNIQIHIHNEYTLGFVYLLVNS